MKEENSDLIIIIHSYIYLRVTEFSKDIMDSLALYKSTLLLHYIMILTSTSFSVLEIRIWKKYYKKNETVQ